MLSGSGYLFNCCGKKKKKELFSIPQDKRDAKYLAAISMFESSFQAKFFW